MARGFKGNKGPFYLFILLLAGGLAGSTLGTLATPYLPVLKNFTTFGIKPVTLDLHFLILTFGILIPLGPVTVLGLILGYFAYKKL